MDQNFRVRIVIGEWAGSANGQFHESFYLSSHSVKELRKAYNKTVSEIELALHQSVGQYAEICVDYEDNKLSEEAREKLAKAGFPLEEIINEEELYSDDIEKLLLWFLKYSLPEVKFEKLEDYKDWDAPFHSLTHYGVNKENPEENMCYTFGYGCFKC